MYELCSNNALCSASIPFIMFIFFLTSFDIQDCYNFELNLNLALLTKLLLTEKACNIVFVTFQTWSNILSLLVFFVCLTGISLDQYCQKEREIQKKILKGLVVYKAFPIGGFPTSQKFNHYPLTKFLFPPKAHLSLTK